MKQNLSIIIIPFLLLSSNICAWAIDNKIQESDEFVTFEEKLEAEKAVSELPQPEAPPAIEEENTDTIIIKFAEGFESNAVLENARVNALDIEPVNISLPVYNPEDVKESTKDMKEIGPEPVNLSAGERSIGLGLSEKTKEESLGENSGDWYWFIGKNYQEADTGKQGDEKSEQISLYYKIKLGNGLTAGEAIARLRGQEGVEYVMPAEAAEE